MRLQPPLRLLDSYYLECIFESASRSLIPVSKKKLYFSKADRNMGKNTYVSPQHPCPQSQKTGFMVENQNVTTQNHGEGKSGKNEESPRRISLFFSSKEFVRRMYFQDSNSVVCLCTLEAELASLEICHFGSQSLTRFRRHPAKNTKTV